jgi:hypothetical protein
LMHILEIELVTSPAVSKDLPIPLLPSARADKVKSRLIVPPPPTFARLVPRPDVRLLLPLVPVILRGMGSGFQRFEGEPDVLR